MSQFKDLSDLIGRIYDSVITPSHWPGVLAEITDRMGGTAASIHLHDPISTRNQLIAEFGTDPQWTTLLLSRYAAMSPIGAAILLAEVDQAVSAFDFIDEAEFRESRYYQEWMKPQGYYDMMGALISKRPTEVGAISTVRALGQGRFGHEEREFLSLVAPHVRRAVQLAGLLEHRTMESGNLKSIVDMLSSAVFVIDRSHRVLHANAAALQICDTPNGALNVSDGRLALIETRASQLLRNAVSAPAPQPSSVVLAFSDGQNRIAAVLPVDAAAGVFVLVMHVPSTDLPAFGTSLIEAFRFTPREIAVLMPLVSGKDIAEVADSLGISLATARTHLQRLFEKSKTSRQADLVRVVMQAMPPVRG